MSSFSFTDPWEKRSVTSAKECLSFTRAAMHLLCVFASFSLLGAEEHNPLLPRPQQIQYGKSRLPINGLEIVLAASPTHQDQFAAEELASGLRSRAHVAMRISGTARRRGIVLARTGSDPDLPQPDEQPGPDSREA